MVLGDVGLEEDVWAGVLRSGEMGRFLGIDVEY